LSEAIKNLTAALKHGMEIRPLKGGFPYLAEVLRQSGVKRNVWSLPACQSMFLTSHGPVVMLGEPLEKGTVQVPKFNQAALIQALQDDQSGKSNFSEFLQAAWKAGVVGYEVDFASRLVSYFGSNGELYSEDYPEVQVSPVSK
jgi:uncharacterized protein YbcV (DUF1398 family)